MNISKPLRVMWLINHTSLRKFEIDQLKKLGVDEIFTPKCFPYDEGNLSASVTHDFDKSLSLNPSEIDLLNQQNWYEDPDVEAWDIANQYFDIIFIAFFPKQIRAACNSFHGAIILRCFGLAGKETYSNVIRQTGDLSLELAIKRVGKRFFFGAGYEHLYLDEDSYLAKKNVFLPVGLNNVNISDKWIGGERIILFVCPRINSSPYFNSIYKQFKENFQSMPYRIGGAQPIVVNDPDVLGYVSDEQYTHNMIQSRVMFYHSQEPNHIHYHPFEAIIIGMPLVFMAGGMLDRMGGKQLPGRCKNLKEAKKKIRRILNGDKRLIESIRVSQPILLKPMDPEICRQYWQKSFSEINSRLEIFRQEENKRPVIQKRKRIAIILPIYYRGGTLRGAVALANALSIGSRSNKETADITIFYLSGNYDDIEDDLSSCFPNVTSRPYKWKTISGGEAKRAMHYAGFEKWCPTSDEYIVPEDDINQLYEFDLWLFVSDKVDKSLLPIKQYIVMVFDYLQRYENLSAQSSDRYYLSFCHSAIRVLTTTKFTYQDALQYAGFDPEKVLKLPMLVPDFSEDTILQTDDQKPPYFLWTTNISNHKNHKNAVEALNIYYEQLDGQLSCIVSGVNADRIPEGKFPHLILAAKLLETSYKLKKYVSFLGELSDNNYKKMLSGATFLWHPAKIDNGTFSVVEAAYFGVPSLSSNYPAMHEINDQFALNLSWMDSNSSIDMAKQLKNMELNYNAKRQNLPSKERLKSEGIEKHAAEYWNAIRKLI